MYERRRRTVADAGPVDLVSVFIPVEIAAGTEITKPEPVAGGLLDYIQSRKGLRGDYASERLTARRATTDEAALLQLSDSDAVLSVLIGVYQSSGVPIMASMLVMPGSRHEIEDSYPLG
ncbi:UTRA domain-containing protein [Luedemannella flava]